MKRFSKSPFHDVEARLREQRPEPRQEFLAALVDTVTPRRTRGRVSARRTLLAAGFSAVVLASLAALGGVSYAASAVNQTARPFTAVARLVGINSSTHAVKAAKTLSKAASSKSTSSRTVRGLSGNKGGNDEHGNGNNGHHGDDEDDDQYKPGKGCGDKNHVHSKHNECKDHGHGHGD